MSHISVMLEEVITAMQPTDGEIYVDGTFGAGGYSEALLSAARCTVYAIDRDPSVQEFARKLQERFPGRFALLMGSFSDMLELLADQGVNSVNGIVLDIGVSSMQFDQAERGFSFAKDGPLDMRMGNHGHTAADIVNNAGEEELANLIYMYGEEHASRRVARAIVNARSEKEITRTAELAEIVRRAVGGKKDGIHPATKTFQALRIAVNDELNELSRALESAEQLLSPGGKLVVVTFHSLEDRIVKRFSQSRSGETGGGSRHLPTLAESQSREASTLPTFSLPHRKAVKPGSLEISRNARARSAKLRCMIRTSHPSARAGGA